MSGVDMADQLLAPYCISRKRLKNYYKTLFIVCRKGMTMTRILLVLVYTLTQKNRTIIVGFHGGGRSVMHLLKTFPS